MADPLPTDKVAYAAAVAAAVAALKPPYRVRAKPTNSHVIFYKSQRIRPGVVFTLERPEDFMLAYMEPVHEALPDELAAKLKAAGVGDMAGGTLRAAAQARRPKTSADLTKTPARPLDPDAGKAGPAAAQARDNGSDVL